MPDVIKLLPDAVANQIAAGEVIQRPASAVKELLENAIDAGADSIQLIIKDAGKTLIQVVDNGTGMTETDARLSFERHATSKIREAKDLFNIRTMGFRGEALASIAAIARVELKTKTKEDQMGTEIIMEAAKLLSQNPCTCPAGTSISVKNLFFNTPARRNFLKSDNAEKRHILAELQRVAIAHPNISFLYYQNNQLTHQLNKANLKQRIANLLGNNYNQRLVPVEENTQIVNISGYVGKPEFAKKSRGEQFFFVNNRFIRSPYLNHAVENAFEELIAEDAHPAFFIFLETDPKQLDVNVHPTKTEIKFQEDKYIYQIIRTAVKRALGNHNLSPSLDFDNEPAFDTGPRDKNKPLRPPGITINPDYNPFDQDASHRPSSHQNLRSRANLGKWEDLFPEDSSRQEATGGEDGKQFIISPDWDEPKQETNGQRFFQLHNRYIVTSVKSGMMVIDQQRAHERVLFERFSQIRQGQKSASQQLLFPENISLSERETDILKEILEPVRALGFGINALGRHTFVIDAIPAELQEEQDLQDVIEGIIENFQKNKIELKDDVRTNLLRSMAKRLSIKHGKTLSEAEMAGLVNSLFASEMPQYTPAGKPVLQIISNEELSDRFK